MAMPRKWHPVSATVAAAIIVAACVELPLERTNYLDPESGTRLVISGVPDTIDAANEAFTVDVSLHPAPPADVQSREIVIEGPVGLVVQVVGSTFRTTTGLGYLPQRAILRASFDGVRNGPIGEREVIVRQVPTALSLTCRSAPSCDPAVFVGSSRTYGLAATDANGVAVRFPAGSFRYGSVLSRAPEVLEVTSRPTPEEIVVRGVAAGSAWLVLSSPSGLADSVLVLVEAP